ncbi:MAG: hypothetical protein PHF12_03840 [Candidatus Omnitrophica bacterium]|nr:hypothetical protein [Candidatus Omnitrophota bacterium]
MSEDTKKEKRKLKRQAELLWRLVTTTAGVADLAEPMKRAEYHFDRLTQRQRITVAVIAKQLAEGFHEIETEEDAREEEAPETVTAEVVQPDAVIPPGEEREG